MSNWAKYIGFNLWKGHRVIREKDAFVAAQLYAEKHPGFFRVKDDGDWLHPSEITRPTTAFEEGYKQAVRDQRRLMTEENNHESGGIH